MSIESILKKKGRHVPTARPDGRIIDVAATLEAEAVGALVVTSECGRIEGIISERDIVRGLTRHGLSVVYKPVSELMTREVITCAPDASVTEVMALMRARRIRHVPVVEDGRLAGLIGVHDVVALRLEEVEAEADGMRDYIGCGPLGSELGTMARAA